MDERIILDDYSKVFSSEETRESYVLFPVHAKWNLADDGDGVICSNCGEDFCTIIYEKERMLYCPHCGSKMDLEDDKNE